MYSPDIGSGGRDRQTGGKAELRNFTQVGSIKRRRVMPRTIKHLTMARIAACLMLACVLVLGLTGRLQSQVKPSASPKGLEGTWWVSVTQYDCTTGATRPPFVSLLAFARGGTMSETTANPAFQPGSAPPGTAPGSKLGMAGTPPSTTLSSCSPPARLPRARCGSTTQSEFPTTVITSMTRPRYSSSIRTGHY